MSSSPPAGSAPLGPPGSLPHRFPFLLLDRVVEVDPGKGGRGLKVVSSGEVLGPEQAMPSLLILEAGAQLLGVVAAAQGEGEDEGPSAGYLAAVEGFEVHREVRAGDRLELEAQVLRRFGPLLQGQIRALVDGEVVAQGRLTAVSDSQRRRRSGAPPQSRRLSPRSARSRMRIESRRYE